MKNNDEYKKSTNCVCYFNKNPPTEITGVCAGVCLCVQHFDALRISGRFSFRSPNFTLSISLFIDL